jgi:hypothetical protein
VYFEGFIAGIDALYPHPVKALVGLEYPRLRVRLKRATDHRSKIFHGQLTDRALTRTDLISLATDIREWCTKLSTKLSDGALAEIGYDGFGRNSFQKSAITDLRKRYRVQLSSVAD